MIMTMLSNSVTRAQLRSRRWPGPTFARARALFVLIFEAFAEGQELARAAHRRYPFAEW
jgi:hypothetical protein